MTSHILFWRGDDFIKEEGHAALAHPLMGAPVSTTMGRLSTTGAST